MARDAEKLAAQSDRIKELRKFARVSQEVAAGAVGVTLRGYQRWERGEGELKGDNLKKLAAYFSTTPDYIEYGTMRRDTPDPFPSTNGTVESELADIKQELADIKASQLALLGDLQEIRRALQSLAKARRSQAS